jgi:predicted signal transduction protein with EAL and GGDEF domain
MPPSVFSGAGYGCGQQIVEAISAVFPFDKIKIDRSFVKEFVERTDCVAIVRAISGLSRSRQGRAYLHVEQHSSFFSAD